MNKQDRQNTTILKRERFLMLASPRILPCQRDYWRKFYGVQKVGAVQAITHHISWAQDRSEARMSHSASSHS